MPPDDDTKIPESERGDLPDHAVPADLVELHQLNELNEAASATIDETDDDEQG